MNEPTAIIGIGRRLPVAETDSFSAVSCHGFDPMPALVPNRLERPGLRTRLAPRASWSRFRRALACSRQA